jgi:hypothetical protein
LLTVKGMINFIKLLTNTKWDFSSSRLDKRA